MKRLGWINLGLLILLAVLAGAHLLEPSDSTRRNFQYFPDMVHSLAHEAQAPAPEGPGGKPVDLRPPVGAVARGYLPTGFRGTPEDAARAGRERVNPVGEDDTDALQRGAFVFSTFCTPCHGAGMHGDGPVTKKGVPPPPSLFLPHALDLPDGRIWHIITFGQGNMASYASQVEREDRWKVVAFIRQAQARELKRLEAEAAAAAEKRQAQADSDRPEQPSAGSAGPAGEEGAS